MPSALKADVFLCKIPSWHQHKCLYHKSVKSTEAAATGPQDVSLATQHSFSPAGTFIASFWLLFNINSVLWIVLWGWVKSEWVFPANLTQKSCFCPKPMSIFIILSAVTYTLDPTFFNTKTRNEGPHGMFWCFNGFQEWILLMGGAIIKHETAGINICNRPCPQLGKVPSFCSSSHRVEEHRKFGDRMKKPFYGYL